MAESGRAEERGWGLGGPDTEWPLLPRIPIRRANKGMALLALWLVRAVKAYLRLVTYDAMRAASLSGAARCAVSSSSVHSRHRLQLATQTHVYLRPTPSPRPTRPATSQQPALATPRQIATHVTRHCCDDPDGTIVHTVRTEYYTVLSSEIDSERCVRSLASRSRAAKHAGRDQRDWDASRTDGGWDHRDWQVMRGLGVGLFADERTTG